MRQLIRSRVLPRLRAFGAREEGLVSVVFALIAVALMTSVGAAVDYARTSGAREMLQAHADAAVLLGATKTSDATIDKKKIEATFQALASEAGMNNVSGVATITKTGNQSTVRLNFSGELPLVFGAFLGLDKVKMSGLAEAVSAGKADEHFTDFFFAIDASASMGIASTAAGITKLEAATKKAGHEQCAFACHRTLSGQKKTNLEIAQKEGVEIRLDVVRNATKKVLAFMADQEAIYPNNKLRAAVHSYAQTLKSVTPLTADLAFASNTLGPISLREEGTFFDIAIPGLLTSMGPQGTGTSETDTEKVLILATDGVQSLNDAKKPTVQIRPLDLTLCNSIKAKGIKLGIIYTYYEKIPNNAWYMKYVNPFQPNLPDHLQGCASPGMYALATSEADIVTAFQNLIIKALGTPRLTQ